MSNRKLSKAQVDILAMMSNGGTLIRNEYRFPPSFYIYWGRGDSYRTEYVNTRTANWLLDRKLIVLDKYEDGLRRRVILAPGVTL